VSTRKLLLADDSVTIQKVVNLTFADEGVEVITVGDGDAAMEKFNEATPDLVMVDVNMPGIDGYRICELIKNDNETKHIPVVLLVGSFEPFDEDEARRVGADDFLTKPFQSIRQLVSKVSDLLNAEKISGAENEVATVNSFDDTLKTKPSPAPREAESIDNFGDAGMDDEMIETSQIIVGLPVNQSPESEIIYQSSIDEADFVALEPQHSFENTFEYKTGNYQAETQPLSKENFGSANHNFQKTGSNHKEINEFADEDEAAQEDFNKKFEQILANNQNSNSEPEDPTVYELDDLNPLELPQSKKDSLSKNQTSSSKSVTPNAPEKKAESESSVKNDDDSSSKNIFPDINDLPPEMLDALADRIVEKISDSLIKKVVEETISQMSRKK
jgi:CheY-like chemotaxis protein